MVRSIARRVAALGPGALALAVGLTPATAAEVMVTGRVVLIKAAARGGASDRSNAVVWLTPIAGRPAQSDVAAVRSDGERIRLIQRHKHFDPRVLVVRVGSAVEFPNLDPFFHNVFSLFEGKRFDLGLYEAGSTRTVKFDRPGISYIFCNIHPEMSAVVVVLETPHYCVTNDTGDVAIPNIAPGRYQLEVWHERSLPESLKALRREVTISEAARSLGIIRVTESGTLTIAHKNKYGREYDAPIPPSPLYEQR